MKIEEVRTTLFRWPFGLSLSKPIHPSTGSGRTRLTEQHWEVRKYIKTNQFAIANYGDRFRQAEPIATGFTESAVKQLAIKHAAKKQQMRWPMRGAHALLQIRTRAQSGELRSCFARWYPSLAVNEKAGKLGT